MEKWPFHTISDLYVSGYRRAHALPDDIGITTNGLMKLEHAALTSDITSDIRWMRQRRQSGMPSLARYQSMRESIRGAAALALEIGIDTPTMASLGTSWRELGRFRRQALYAKRIEMLSRFEGSFYARSLPEGYHDWMTRDGGLSDLIPSIKPDFERYNSILLSLRPATRDCGADETMRKTVSALSVGALCGQIIRDSGTDETDHD